MTQTEMKTIFGSIEVIRNYNAFFLERLQERVQNWQESDCVGDLFLQVAQWLKTYSAYINNYDAALNLLSKVSKRVEVKRFMKVRLPLPVLSKINLSLPLVVPLCLIPSLSSLSHHSEAQSLSYARNRPGLLLIVSSCLPFARLAARRTCPPC